MSNVNQQNLSNIRENLQPGEILSIHLSVTKTREPRCMLSVEPPSPIYTLIEKYYQLDSAVIAKILSYLNGDSKEDSL